MPNNLHSAGMDLAKEKVLYLLLLLTFVVREVFFSNQLGFRTSLGAILTLPSLQWQNYLSLKEPLGDNKFLSSCPLQCLIQSQRITHAADVFVCTI